jgi:hypothetical protein
MRKDATPGRKRGRIACRYRGNAVSVVPFNRFQNYFDDGTTALMGEAYQAACEALEGKQPDVVREVLAKRILHAVRTGERDGQRLREIALAGILPPDLA